MQECEVMVGFESDGGHEARLNILSVEVVGHEHEDGPDAFSTEREDIAYGGIESLRLAFEGQVGDGFADHLKELLAAIHYIIYKGVKVLALPPEASAEKL
jgi:hypothetical protein